MQPIVRSRSGSDGKGGGDNREQMTGGLRGYVSPGSAKSGFSWRKNRARIRGFRKRLLEIRSSDVDQSPPMAASAARSGISMVAPLKVTRWLFLNSLRVLVTVSRVEPTHSAICS